jgi:hypothetical protein
MDKNVYLKIMEAYNKATVGEAMKRACARKSEDCCYQFFAIVAILIFLGIVYVFLNALSYTYTFYVFVVLLVLLVLCCAKYVDFTRKSFKKCNAYFSEKFIIDVAFFKDNAVSLKGARFLLFAEELRKNNLDIKFKDKDTQELIAEERELETYSFLNDPLASFLGAGFMVSLGAFLEQCDKLLPFLSLLAFSFFLILFRALHYPDILWSKALRKRELQLFLVWYQLFGKSLFDDKPKNNNKTEDDNTLIKD